MKIKLTDKGILDLGDYKFSWNSFVKPIPTVPKIEYFNYPKYTLDPCQFGSTITFYSDGLTFYSDGLSDLSFYLGEGLVFETQVPYNSSSVSSIVSQETVRIVLENTKSNRMLTDLQNEN